MTFLLWLKYGPFCPTKDGPFCPFFFILLYIHRKNSDDTFIRPKHDSISVKGILFQNQSLHFRMDQFYGFYPISQRGIKLDQRG